MKNLLLPATILLATTSVTFSASAQTAVKHKAVAAKSAVTTAGASASSAAKAELLKVLNKLSGAQSLSYTSELFYATPGPTGPVEQKTDTVVSVERPSKMSVTTSADGKTLSVLSSSGSLFTIYDATSGKFAQKGTGADWASAMGALAATGSTLFGQVNPQQPLPSEESLKAALGFPMSFMNKQFFPLDAPAGDTVNFTSVPEIVNGKKFHEVTETLAVPSRGSLKFTFVIDPANSLPLSQVVEEIPSSKVDPPVTVMKETYTDLKVSAATADDSVYSFSPPATATQITIAPPDQTQLPNPVGAPVQQEPATPAAPAAPAAPTPAQPGAAPGTPIPTNPSPDVPPAAPNGTVPAAPPI